MGSPISALNDDNWAHFGHFKKLRLDFDVMRSMCRRMEDKTKRARLSVHLLVVAGALMEDECVPLIASDPGEDSLLAARVSRLTAVAADLTALAAAADVLRRLENDGT